MNTKQYVLQEILSEQELERFLRLRYDCFCRSDAELFVSKNTSNIDLNYYDRNSRHYGLYLANDQSKEPAGYFRIVLEEPTKADKWVQNISQRLGLTNLTEHKPASRFPCLGMYPDTKLEKHFFTKRQATEKIGEASRLLIVNSERSVKLSLELIKIAFAIAALYIQHAFVGCFKGHSKAYTRIGFRQYPGSSAFFPDASALQKEAVLLYCRAEYLRSDLKTKLKIMQTQFVENKSLTFYL
ncbi:MAG: hypothetical protein ABIR18_15520 [Chitinophagaceae bacterium]